MRDSRLNATGHLQKPNPASAKNTASYKHLASNYLSMFGKKEREASKGSRCSQRKPSANATPKSKAIRPHLGKDKLSKLLQPSTPSEGAKLATEANERITGYLSSNSKRKNSSTSTLNKKQPPEHRASLAFKSSAKLSPSTPATISYIHPKSTIDIKREILANKLSAGLTQKRPAKTEEAPSVHGAVNRTLCKTSGPVLGGFVTQVVSLPFTAKIDNSCSAKTSSSSTSKQRSAMPASLTSSLKRKKKAAAGTGPAGSSEVRLSLKNPGVFYMQKLEVSFKECAEDEQSVLFRQHFKQTIQTLAMLANIGDSVKPYEDKQRVLLPPLKKTSTSGSPDMKTIIFDLDETLIHCNEDQESACDTRVPVHFPTGEFTEVSRAHPGRHQHPPLRALHPRAALAVLRDRCLHRLARLLC